MDQPTEPPVTHEIGKRTYVVADVDPLDVDGVRTVAVGTAVWLVGFLALLPFYGRLREDGHTWWLWTCLAGFGLGLAGWDYCRRRRRHRLERRASEEAADGPLPPTTGTPTSGTPTSGSATSVNGTSAGPVSPARPAGPPAHVPAPSSVPSSARPPAQKPPFRPRGRDDAS